jgi:hypothetical protein
MIPFAVIVVDVLCHRATEVPLPQRNQAVQAFSFDRSYEAFGVGARVWRALRNQHNAGARVPKPTPDITAPFPIPIADQHLRYAHDIRLPIVSVRTICCVNSPSGCGVEPRICTQREAKSITNAV